MGEMRTWTQMEELFHQVLTLPEERRLPFLQEVCRDEKMLNELLTLISSDQVAPTLASPIQFTAGCASFLGDKLGPYRLIKTMAEGGMGIVFLAERDDGEFHKKVAIKCLKEYFSADRAQRFFFEKEVLASLDHPNICKLLDAGIAENGQPYFVMDFIEGQTLMEYARDRPLDERLQLFLQICDAVHYAHQNLVIHRDLKPSNILVDESGKVHLLDFGISKVLGGGPDLTKSFQQVMTPQYASPEQVTGQAVSLATDVYGCGLLLFELISSKKLFGEVNSSNLSAMTKAVVHSNPPLPSEAVDLTSLPGDKPSLLRWQRALKQDLDWVCLKALAKKPLDRYASVSALKSDILRFTLGDPVSVRKQHRTYILGKHLRKHRSLIGYVCMVLMLLVSSSVYYTQQIAKERNEALHQADKNEQMVAFLSGILQTTNPQSGNEKKMTREELLELATDRLQKDLADQPETQAELKLELGYIYFQIGKYNESILLARQAQDFFKAGPRPNAKLAKAHVIASNSLIKLHQFEDAHLELQLAQKNHPGSPDPSHAFIYLNWALMDVKKNEFEQALVHLDKAQKIIDLCEDCPKNVRGVLYHRRALLELLQGHLSEAELYYGLGFEEFENDVDSIINQAGDMIGFSELLIAQGAYDRAEPLIYKALEIREKYLEEDHPTLGQTHHFLGLLYKKKGQFAQAEQAYRKALAIRQKNFGNYHPETTLTLSNLGIVLRHLGQFSEAETVYEMALDGTIQQLGLDHWQVGVTYNNLGRLLFDMERYQTALNFYCKALDVFYRAYEPDHFYIGITRLNLGNVFIKMGDLAKAQQELDRAQGNLVTKLGERHPLVGLTLLAQTKLALLEGRPNDGCKLVEKAQAIFLETYDESDPRFLEVYQLLIACYEKQGHTKAKQQVIETLKWNGALTQALNPYQQNELEALLSRQKD
ncbi:MAG: serine/threonine protein kinase [Acidobacteria bacterium]|nr:serine/threonine protein kinase [Acidobacteriota bacterium]MCB9396243.1 serine/threonine protein kinase [Acidobacteriota bacterium]